MTREATAVTSRPRRAFSDSGANPIRILIADDHLVYRIGIRNLLGSEPGFNVIGEASDGLQAIEQFCLLRPDVLLLDLRMPHRNGIEVVQAVRAQDPKARVIVVTSYQTEEEVFRALQAGALGYVLKDVGRDTLIEAIRAVHSGTRWVPAEIQMQFASRGLRQELTSREIEVLHLLARGLTNREIAGVYKISANTVKNHLNNLMAKLEVTDRTEAVSYCFSRGIVRPEDV